MTPRDIITVWRDRHLDAAAMVWTDAELLSYIDEAQIEATQRNAFIADMTSDACTYPVAAGDPLIETDPSILKVREARLRSNREHPLLVRRGALENPAPDWEDHDGPPLVLIVGYDDTYARLYPAPVADDILSLSIYRMPMYACEMDTELEIRPQWQHHLSDWVTYRALMKPGSRYDATAALVARAHFVDGFGMTRNWYG